MKNNITKLSILLMLVLPKPTSAMENPSINFNGIIGNPKPGLSSTGNTNDKYNSSEFIFRRFLGLSKEQIISNEHFNCLECKIQSKSNKIGNNFEKLTVKLKLQYFKLSLEGIYILNNNQAVGYCLAEPVNITGLTNKPFIKKIKMLKVNSGYFDKIKLSSNIDLKLYQRDKNNFLEKYVIAHLKNKNSDFILLDAFYPKELDRELKGNIEHEINKSLKNINNK